MRNIFNFNNDTDKKSKLIKIISLSSILIIVFAIAVTMLVIGIKKQANSGNDQTTSIKSQAEDLKTQAIKAEQNNDDKSALNLYKEAKAKYQQANDTNGVIDMDAKIYLIEQDK